MNAESNAAVKNLMAIQPSVEKVKESRDVLLENRLACGLLY